MRREDFSRFSPDRQIRRKNRKNLKYAALLHRHTILHTVEGQLASGEIEHDHVMKLRRANEKSDENSTEKDNSK